MNNGQLLNKMLKLVVEAHSGQFDKSGKPYVMHVLTVMHYLKSEDEELQCIALGHDVVEDTKTTYQDLYDLGMSTRVVEGIKALTKQKGQTLEEYKKGVFANKDAMLVKLCDLRHNSDIRRLKGISPKDIERTVKYHEFYTEIQNKLK